jgi:hypothetical protein
MNRFKQGLAFDSVLGLHFTVNIVFVVNQLLGQLILKLKQMKYRYNYRKRYRKTAKKEEIKATTIPKDAISADTKSKLTRSDDRNKTVANDS